MPKLGGGAFGTGNWEEDLKFFRSVHLEPVRWRENVFKKHLQTLFDSFAIFDHLRLCVGLTCRRVRKTSSLSGAE